MDHWAEISKSPSLSIHIFANYKGDMLATPEELGNDECKLWPGVDLVQIPILSFTAIRTYSIFRTSYSKREVRAATLSHEISVGIQRGVAQEPMGNLHFSIC